MRRSFAIVLGCIAFALLVTGIAGAGNIAEIIRLKTVKNKGTAVDFTSRNRQPAWNFTGGFAYSADGGHYNVGRDVAATFPIVEAEAATPLMLSTFSCPNCAHQNPDLGPTLSPRGSQINTTTAKPTCVIALVNTLWSEDGGADGGTRLFQCMHKANDTYAWVLIAQAG